MILAVSCRELRMGASWIRRCIQTAEDFSYKTHHACKLPERFSKLQVKDAKYILRAKSSGVRAHPTGYTLHSR